MAPNATVGELPPSAVMTTYVPMALNGAGAPGAVAEVFQDLRPTQAAATRFQHTIDLLLVAGLALLYALQLPIARRAGQRLQRQAATLVDSERRFRSLVQGSSDLVSVADTAGVLTYESPASHGVLGRGPAVAGTSITELVHGDDVDRVRASLEDARRREVGLVEARWRHGDGTWRLLETRISNLGTDSPGGLVLNSRGRGHLAVVFIDLDNFKVVNDTAGHGAGDDALREVARRVAQTLRPSDTVARLGGDEFAVLLEDLAEPSDAGPAAARILSGVAGDLTLGHLEIELRATAGVAVAPDGGRTSDELLRNADLAMYRGKAHGGGVAVYNEAMHADLVASVSLETDLRHAAKRNELEVHYQPIVDVATGQVAGAEALLRWRHPERGLVPPAEFIPLAESSSLIVDIGRWVLAQSINQASSWIRQAAVRPDFKMSVNIFSRQVTSELVADVERMLEAARLAPSQLVLEITETTFMSAHDETARTLVQLRSTGIKLALDDFGTGYSSLSYLQRFPVDALKVDRSFVEHVAGSEKAAALVRTVVQLAATLGLRVVAEGVETREQAKALSMLSCDLAQGWLYAPAVPADGFVGLGRVLGPPQARPLGASEPVNEAPRAAGMLL